jgi:hypothetical protein
MSKKFKLHSNLTRITVLYMNTNIRLWSCVSQFCLERKTFQTCCTENQFKYFTFSNFFPRKIVPFVRQCGKILDCRTDHMTIWRMRIACRATKATHTRSHAHTHNQNMYNCCFSTATMVARGAPVWHYGTLSCLLLPVIHSSFIRLNALPILIYGE